MSKRILLPLLLLATFISIHADEVFTHGDWKVTVVDADGTLKLHHLKTDGTYRPIFISSAAEADYDTPTGTACTVRATDFAEFTTAVTDTVDAVFGPASRFDIHYTQPANGDNVSLTVHFWFFDQRPSIFTSAELSCPETIRSNRIVPIRTGKTFVIFNSDARNRMLKVPYDNDGFVRYHRYTLTTSMTSYEVSALYEGDSRNGLVIGSVDHDHWKSAILVDAEKNDRIKSLRLQSGISSSETHDVIPHGKIEGNNLSSTRFYVGFSDDWRDEMKSYTDACCLVVPKRETWPYGNPVGWMSWNVLETKNNYTDDLETMQFIGNELRPAGFLNNQQAPNIISIDSWSNLSESQERSLCKEAKSLGSVVGCYGTPFALWWGDDGLDNVYYSSSLSQYKAREVVLTANGQPLKYDGAFCLDPTHPAVKASCGNWIRSQYEKGFRYFKLDFTTNGALQADHYYNPDVHTAVEAYNEGFAYFCKQVDDLDEPVFIVLSISPLFPYQYANARRIACDTWGSINWTEYSMNAITAGWWTDGLYQYNDPDGLPMIGKDDQISNSMSENRARITNGAVAGMVLMADNFSVSNKSGNGNPSVSRLRAKTLLTNPGINEVIGLGRSFRPVYGYGEYQGHSDGAENFAMLRTDSCLYLAVINYSTSAPLSGRLSLERIGLTPDEIREVRELWFDTSVTVTDVLSYNVPVKDARLYKFTLNPTSVQALTETLPESDKRIYDRSGHEGSVPEPAPIYIQYGQKRLQPDSVCTFLSLQLLLADQSSRKDICLL